MIRSQLGALENSGDKRQENTRAAATALSRRSKETKFSIRLLRQTSLQKNASSNMVTHPRIY